MKKKSILLPGIPQQKIADLEEMAKKLSMLPREEQMYIKGRMDAYNDRRRQGRSPDNQQAS